MKDNVSFRQLRAFLAVVQERSFTRAAARLRLTQPAVSSAVGMLEQELGLRLLDRSTRVVVPTRSGELFAMEAERLLRDMGDVLEDLRAHAQRQRGQVVVSAAPSFIEHILAPALVRLSELHPGLHVRLLQDHTSGARQRVLRGEVDFAITSLSLPDPDLDVLALVRDRFGVILPAGHPLAREGGPLDVGRLRGLPMVGLTAENGIRATVDSHFPKWLSGQRLRYEVSSASALPSLVEAGLGIALLPALTAGPMAVTGRLVFRPLEPEHWRRISMGQRAGRSLTPAALAVLEVLLGRLREIHDPHVQPLASPEATRPGGGA